MRFFAMNIPSFDPERNYLVYVVDMQEAIDLIQQYTHEMTEVVFSQNRAIQDAVVQRIQIIGEAASHIPNIIREQFSDIPWKKIVAMRNLLIHDYAHVDEHEVWRVVKEDIPLLRPQLVRVKKSLASGQLKLKMT